LTLSPEAKHHIDLTLRLRDATVRVLTLQKAILECHDLLRDERPIDDVVTALTATITQQTALIEELRKEIDGLTVQADDGA